MISFVTGGTGFIGQRLVAALQQEQTDVRLLSRSRQNKDTIVCDLKMDSIPNNALIGIDTVFHLAGFAHDMGDANKIKKLYYEINVEATIRLAELAVKSNVKKFIFVSSVKAGGLPNSGQCANEDSQNTPDGIYGKTKRKAELALLDIAKKSDMHISIIRPSLVYGPNVKGNLQLMLSGIKKGWFPPLPEIGNRRSMIHVDDLVRAMLFLAKDDRANGEIFIATDGEMHSSREIYDAMRGVLNKTPCSWSMPIFIFNIASLMGGGFKYKVDKLLGDECYSSNKLHNLGFIVTKSLDKINKTSFKLLDNKDGCILPRPNVK